MKPRRYCLSPAMAAWVRRLREGGATWTEIAQRLGWPLGNAPTNIRGALAAAEAARAPEEAPPDEAAREAEERRAEADPVLGRRCARCGAKGYRVNTHHAMKAGVRCDEYVAVAVPMTLLGGRWLCPKCAPRRRRAPDVCPAFAQEYRTAFR